MADQPVPTPKAPARRSEQDQAIANLITEAQQLIETARDDAEIALLLAARGYNAQKLAEGLALQASAQAAFTARQTALAAQKQAAAAVTGAETTAQHTYVDFRETARAVFTSSADRTALGLLGKVPADTQKFITQARASYTTAQTEAYQATLATYGFSAATIAAALATLDVFSDADKAHQSALGAATQATADRDAAVKELNAWVKQFTKIAGVALKNQPALAKKLGL
jgi:hypothetical protein